MNKSEQINELASALCKAQAMMGGAVKDAKNPHFKNDYATLESVIECIRAPFLTNGLSYTQLLGEGDGTHVIIETVLLHTSGQWLSERFAIPTTKHDAQGFGSAVTYGRRYTLAALGGIAQVDDDGEAARHAAKADDKPKYGTNGAEVCKIEFDRLPPDEQTSMRLHGSIVIACKTPEFATDYIDKQEFTHEERMALWHLLPSALRASIKKVQAAQLATQA